MYLDLLQIYLMIILRLDEYIDCIKDDIFSSEYTGEDLAEMDLIALKVMGIKNIKIRRDILK